MTLSNEIAPVTETAPVAEATAPAPTAKAPRKAKAKASNSTAIKTLADLGTALTRITASAAKVLSASTFGNMYRTVSAGHVNKRGLFVAAIIDTMSGDGTLDTLRSRMAHYSVPALRAELQYAIASKDASYFRARNGEFCGWALPLVKDGALDPNANDTAIAKAFESTCPTNRANVNGMLTEITLAARKRNVQPLPVFADVVVSGKVVAYDRKAHGDNYASKGYGNATFTLVKSASK